MDYANYWYSSGATNTAPPIDYPIGTSIRFRSWAYANLYRTQLSQEWIDAGVPDPVYTQGTVSFWWKNSTIEQGLPGLSGRAGGSSYWYNVAIGDMKDRSTIWCVPNDLVGPQIGYNNRKQDSNDDYYAVDGYLNDQSGWYHVLVNYNHDNGSRVVKYYINGVERLNIYPSRDQIMFNGGYPVAGWQQVDFTIGRRSTLGGQEPNDQGWTNGYMADFYCLDTELPPERWGFYNEQGIWQPKDPELTPDMYGLGGVHLTFDPSQDPDPMVGIGIDSSGNNQHYSATGFQLTDPTLASYDSFTDSPTNNMVQCNNVCENVCGGGNGNIEWANRQQIAGTQFKPRSSATSQTMGVGLTQNAPLTIMPEPGSKLFYQFEVQASSPSQYWCWSSIAFCPKLKQDPQTAYREGIAFSFRSNVPEGDNDPGRKTWVQVNNPDLDTPVITWPQLTGEMSVGGNNPLQYSESEGGLWCGVFYDYDSGDIWFLTNKFNDQWSENLWEPQILKPDGTYVTYTGTLPADCAFNFPEARLWTYRYTTNSNEGGYRGVQAVNAWEQLEGSLPNGFKFATHVTELPKKDIPNGEEFFKAVTYAGTNANQTIDCGFAPDLVAIKRTSGNGGWWNWFDTIRGPQLSLSTNDQSGELAEPNRDTSLTSFTSNGFTIGVDPTSGADWNASGQSYVAYCWKGGGTAVANNDGTTASQVSASPKSGFSVVKYTGTGTTATVGHGLGKAPDMIWIKNLDANSNWCDYVSVLPPNKYTTTSSYNVFDSDTVFNNTAPTDTVFSVSSTGEAINNQAGVEYIAYCWTSVEGYCSIQSYIGNEYPPLFVPLDYQPATCFVTDVTPGENRGWHVYDSANYPYNNVLGSMLLDRSDGIQTGDSVPVALQSNGWRIMSGDWSTNRRGNQYMLFAWGKTPQGGSNCYPATGQ